MQLRKSKSIPALATLLGAAALAIAPLSTVSAQQPPPMPVEQPTKNAQVFSFAAQRKADKTDLALSNVHTQGRFTIQDELWPADFKVPAHFHAKHSEVFIVLSGQVEWTVNGETHVMGAGDMVFIPPNTPHAVQTVGGKEANMIMIYEPGGYEDDALRQSLFTPEQRKDPKIAETLRKLGDFHLTTMPERAK